MDGAVRAECPQVRERRWFIVRIPGEETVEFFAESPSQAKAMAFRALKDAGYLVDFLPVCQMARARLSPDQGDPRTPEFGVAS